MGPEPSTYASTSHLLAKRPEIDEVCPDRSDPSADCKQSFVALDQDWLYRKTRERKLGPLTDVSPNKMLRDARTAAMTGRTAA
jgi:hypothetical protein